MRRVATAPNRRGCSTASPLSHELKTETLASGAGAGHFQRVGLALGEQFIDPLALAHEGVELLALENLAHRQSNPHRVDLAHVDHQFIVEMCTGRQARRSDKSDHLTLPDLDTWLDA